MHASTLHRQALMAGAEFRISGGQIQFRGATDGLEALIHAHSDGLLRYADLRREHGAQCQACGEPPIERLSINGLCWTCQLVAIGHKFSPEAPADTPPAAIHARDSRRPGRSEASPLGDDAWDMLLREAEGYIEDESGFDPAPTDAMRVKGFG